MFNSLKCTPLGPTPTHFVSLELDADYPRRLRRILTRQSHMKRSPYFASKPRACMTEEHVISMSLLKLAMRSCLLSGGSLSYGERVYVYALEDCLQIVRPAEPADTIEVDPSRVEDAINIFVDMLAYEVTFNPDNFVLIQSEEVGGVSWGHLRRNHVVRSMCNPRVFPFESLVTAPTPAPLDETLDGE